MSKKDYDTANIENEFSEGSAFFKGVKKKKSERTEFRTDNRTEERPENRSLSLPIKRPTKRYSFEFYEDQIAAIKKIKIEAQLRNENINLSEIVREAIDLYFKTVRNNERTEIRTEIRT
jgi:hypothetical protein